MKLFKKTLTALLALSAAAAISSQFVACSDDDEDEAPSAVPSGFSAPAKTAESKADKGGEVKQTIKVDGLNIKASARAVSTSSLAVGSDISEFVKASIVNNNGFSDAEFTPKAIVTSVSENSIEFELTGTAPGEDCSIVLGLTIPETMTGDGIPAVKPVQKIDVGEGTTVSDKALDPVYPTNAELKEKFQNKVLLKIDDEDEKRYFYWLADNRIGCTKYENNTQKKRLYDYNEATGVMTRTDDTSDSITLIKVDDKFLFYEGTLERKSGEGLTGIFSAEYQDEYNILEDTFVMNGDNTYYYSSYEREYKEKNNKTTEENWWGSGAYVNKDGFLYLSGRMYYIITENGETESGFSDEFHSTAGLYMGDKILDVSILIEEDFPTSMEKATLQTTNTN